MLSTPLKLSLCLFFAIHAPAVANLDEQQERLSTLQSQLEKLQSHLTHPEQLSIRKALGQARSILSGLSPGSAVCRYHLVGASTVEVDLTKERTRRPLASGADKALDRAQTLLTQAARRLASEAETPIPTY